MQPDIICYCGNVTRFEIEKAVKAGAKSIEDIRWVTNACKGSQCESIHPEKRCCIPDVKEIIIAEHGCLGGNCSCCN